MDKLTEIMAWKRREIAPLIREVNGAELQSFRDASRSGSFMKALQAPEGLAVISEIKRRSPSAGEIKPIESAASQATAYARAGSDCLSILTDEKYFGGRLEDLESSRQQLSEIGFATPCLRKDFMIHPVQVLEAAQAGAAAILIIVRALTDEEMTRLRNAADLAGLDALYEIHSEAELERAVAQNARIIGVNNRDLAVFKTDLRFSEELIPKIPSEALAVSESGIWNGKDAIRARDAGAKAILVGEALMRTESIEKLIEAFHSA
jgi:indole-3-glycerol phosphate synthase